MSEQADPIATLREALPQIYGGAFPGEAMQRAKQAIATIVAELADLARLRKALDSQTFVLESRPPAWLPAADAPFGVYVWALYEPIRGPLELRRLRREARGAITWSSDGFICAERLIHGWLPESALPVVPGTRTSGA